MELKLNNLLNHNPWLTHAPNTHNRPSNMCITCTQNMFIYHKVKINEAKGRLGEKIPTIFFYAFNFFG